MTVVSPLLPFVATLLAALSGARAAVPQESAPAPTPSAAGLRAAAPAGPVATGPTVVLDRIAAVVGDELVTEGEVRRLMAVGVVPRMPGETDDAYRERVLQVRIVELLRERELHLGGEGEPDPAQLAARMASIRAGVEARYGMPYDEALASLGLTAAEVRGWVSRGLALEAFARERLLPTIRPTDEELKAYYEGPFRAEAAARGLTTLPPFSEVQDRLRELVRERRLTEEISRWTEELRGKTRIVIYRRGPAAAGGAGAGSAPSESE